MRTKIVLVGVLCMSLSLNIFQFYNGKSNVRIVNVKLEKTIAERNILSSEKVILKREISDIFKKYDELVIQHAVSYAKIFLLDQNIKAAGFSYNETELETECVETIERILKERGEVIHSITSSLPELR